MSAGTVRRHLLATRSETVEGVIDGARAVAAEWDGPSVREADAITRPLRRRLATTGLTEALIGVLRAATDPIDATIRGDPVAAPPYLAVTSRGPVCRGTLTDGRRLVIAVVAFGVERRPVRYRFLDPSPAEALEVRFRSATRATRG